jgi:hypothetical protein
LKEGDSTDEQRINASESEDEGASTRSYEDIDEVNNWEQEEAKNDGVNKVGKEGEFSEDLPPPLEFCDWSEGEFCDEKEHEGKNARQDNGAKACKLALKNVKQVFQAFTRKGATRVWSSGSCSTRLALVSCLTML